MTDTGNRTLVRTAAVTIVGVAGLTLFAQAAMHVPTLEIVVAIAAGAVTEVQRARVRAGVAASMVNVALLTAVILAGPWVLVGVAAGAALGAWKTYPAGLRAKSERLVFNFGLFAISGVAGGFLFEALVGPAPATGVRPVTVGLLLPLLMAAATFTLVNLALLAAIVWISSGERPRSLFQSLGPMMLMQPAFVAYALVAAALIAISPLSLVLLAVPLLMSRSALAAFEEITEATESLLKTLISLIEQRDGYTKGHAERVAELAVMFARDLGYSHSDLQTVRHAALLHDIGKVCVPLEVIRKPGRLDREEFEAIKLHPVIGARVLEDVDALKPALDGILHHHERIDGTGYPDGLSGDEIPHMVRVVTIADAFDAMTSTRSYRKAMSVEEALSRLVEAGGSQFDAELVSRFLRVIEREGWQPTVAPVETWPVDGEVEPVDNCCAPTLSEQFGAFVGSHQHRLAEGTAN